KRRITFPALSAYRQRDLLQIPGLSRWMRLAIERGGGFEIVCPHPDLDAAINAKLNPEIGPHRLVRKNGRWRYELHRTRQSLKVPATRALDHVLRPRRSGRRPAAIPDRVFLDLALEMKTCLVAAAYRGSFDYTDDQIARWNRLSPDAVRDARESNADP